jgi:hypothetical protein
MSRITKSRMCMLAIATALAIGSMATAVEAKGGHHAGKGGGGGGGGHAISKSFSGGGGRGISRSFHAGRSFRHGHRFHRRGGYYPYYYSGYRSCYRWRRVLTPYGWHFRRINVCYRPYRYLYGF